MMTLKKQRIVIALLTFIAAAALALGIFYQGANNPALLSEDEKQENIVGPIRSFLPDGGTGAACREPVGVRLEPGYEATLVINGIPIAPEEMNINFDENGDVSDDIDAERSSGEFSFRPDTECPQGKYIRATNNVLDVCVYKNSDSTKTCILKESYTFNAI